MFRVIITTVLCLGLSGCGIGGFWMNGSPFTAPSKPYLQRWEKPDISPEQRRYDSRGCGSDWPETAAYPDDVSFSNERMNTTKKPGENVYATDRRLFDDWQRCMLKKGYVYTGMCQDTEISRSRPACGAA